jgi:acetyl-CoA C-acetyltransferase
MSEAFIVAAARTAIGRRGGRLREWHPVDLAAEVLQEVVRRADIDPALIDDVIVGVVGQVGPQSANLARHAVLTAGFPESVPGTTVDRQCGSSQQAIQFAAQAVMSGSQDIVIAAGVESMTKVPIKLQTSLAVDHGYGGPVTERFLARYPEIEINQFAGAERIAVKYGLSREAMDRYGWESHRRAAAAAQAGAFRAEILPLDGLDAGGQPVRHDSDEGVRYEAELAAMAKLKLLREDGRLTAGTASQLSDGAAAVLVVSGRMVKELGLTPLARIHHVSVLGDDPILMLAAPIPATERALKKAGLVLDDIDLFEVNEAFASIPMAWLQATGVDPEKLNVNGGAIALGHPLGASGARIMTTLVHALKARGKRYGLETMCEGGGLANVTIVEAL